MNIFPCLKRTCISTVEFFVSQIYVKYHNKIYVEQRQIPRSQLTSTMCNIHGRDKLSSLHLSQNYQFLLVWHTIMPHHYSGLVNSLSHCHGIRYYFIVKKCIIKLKRNIYFSFELLIYEHKYLKQGWNYIDQKVIMNNSVSQYNNIKLLRTANFALFMLSDSFLYSSLDISADKSPTTCRSSTFRRNSKGRGRGRNKGRGRGRGGGGGKGEEGGEEEQTRNCHFHFSFHKQLYSLFLQLC